MTATTRIRLLLDPKFDDGYGGLASGGAGNDTITGTGLADVLLGGAGNDAIEALAGNDQIFGGDGDDGIGAGAGNDQAVGAAGNDTVRGNDGNDTLYGDEGDDGLFGDDGNDRLEGSEGSDFLQGGRGNDLLAGGDDNDELVDGFGINVLDGEGGLDTIRTLGDASSRNTILDASANLIGGAGQETVTIGDAFALGQAIVAGTRYDGGANTDIFIAGSLDLNALAPRLLNFETLRIVAGAGETKTLVTAAGTLGEFDRLFLEGEGAVVIDVTSGDFAMDSLLTSKAFPIDFSGLTPVANLQDGSEAGIAGRPVSQLAPLTISLNGVLGGAGGTASGPAGSALGLTFVGSDGNDTITGGGGSDVIIGGLGADNLNGGRSDAGDRFDLDSAVGDVFLGTPEEFDGDSISNLSNRVDRVRITESQDYVLDVTYGTSSSTVAIYASQTAFDNGDPALGSFTLIGNYPKLVSRAGSYVDEGGNTVEFIELFNNNIPPTAVDDDIVVSYQGPDDNGIVIDPFGNDFDADTPADPAAGIVRRQIALTESLAALFRLVDVEDEDAARLAFANGTIPAALIGTEFITDKGNRLFVGTLNGETAIFLDTPEPVATLRGLQAGDPWINIFGDGDLGRYDLTEGLPFFGRDRITYKVFDLEGELSNVAAIDILIRPDQVTASGGGLRNPVVTIDAVSPLNSGIFEVSLQDVAAGATVGTDRASGNFSDDFTLYATGNDRFVITDPGSYFGRTGDDVLDARDATGSVALFGGRGSDWVEGGAFADYLAGGGTSDTGNAGDLHAAGPGDPGNILLGGGGDNVFSASFTTTAGDLGFLLAPGRPTTFVLDGGSEIITGPMHSAGTTNTNLDFDPIFGLATMAYSLQGDNVIGFDNDDQIVLALDRDVLTAGTFQPNIFEYDENGAVVASDGFIPDYSGFVSTSLDLTDYLGEQPRAILGTYPGTGSEDAFDFINNLFPGNDFDTSFANYLPLPQTGEIIVKRSTFDGNPGMLSYAVEADSIDENGGSSPTTTLTISLKAFRLADLISPDPTNPVAGAVLVEAPELLDPFNLANDFFFSDDDPTLTDLIPDAHVTFSMELDGQYQDRFVIDLVSGSTGAAAPFLSVSDAGTSYSEPDYVYEYLTDAEVRSIESAGGNLALSIRYESFAPVGVADTATLRRGDAIAIDLTANDTDADGDQIGIFDFVFDNEADELRLLDNDTSNGEIIAETDPDTGLGTGRITYVADPDFIGTETFSYIPWDGEYQSDPTNVSITVTGLPPVLGDDRIILPFNAAPEILLSDLTANDFDPDVGSVGSRFNLPQFQGGGFDFPGVFDIDWRTIEITSGAYNAMRSNTVDEDGRNGAVFSFTYSLLDTAGGGRSDPARVEVSYAAPLNLFTPFGLTTNEDEALSIDVLAGRFGGYGEAEIVFVSTPVAVGGTTPVGAAEVSGNGIVFTPFDDISGVTAQFTVRLRDELGQQVNRTLQVVIDPVDDATEVKVISPAGDADRLITDEDVALSGSLVLFDPDLADPALLGIADAAALLAGLAGDPSTIDPAILAAIASNAPVPADLGPLATDDGGTLVLVPTANPLVYDYIYTPGIDANGPDSVSIELLPTSGQTVGDTLVLPIDVAPVNDAPRFVATEPDPLAPIIIEIGADQPFNLLQQVADIDSAVDPASLQITGLPDPAIVSASFGADGSYNLTGLASGQGSFAFSIADVEGARSEERSVFFKVNAAPETAVDRVTVSAPFDPILIDAIANDSDAEGAIAYVLGDDGLPVAIDPKQAVDATAAPGLLGSVTWSEADNAFLYQAPTDPAFWGKTDQFFYDIVDADGSTARGSVIIDIVSPDPEAIALVVGSEIDKAFAAAPGLERFVFGSGTDTVTGEIADLDGDEVIGFAPGDSIVISGINVADLTVSATRERAEKPTPIAVDDINLSVTPETLFGTVALEEFADAFIGDTLVTLSVGGEVGTLRLDGAYLGSFSAVDDGNGNVILSYQPTATGTGSVAGTGEDDDLRVEGAASTVGGDAGDDILRGLLGADSLAGDAGDDVLIGGGGGDSSSGGAGADLFLLTDRTAPETILDFNPFEGDRIAIGIDVYLNDDLTVALDRLRIVQTGDVYELIGNPNRPDENGVLPTDLPEETLLLFTVPVGLVAGPDAVSGDEDTVIDGTVADDVSGIDAAGRIFALDSGPANGTVVVNGDGTFSYTPNADFNGEDSFRYAVSLETEIGTLIRTADVTVSVAPVADAPSAVDDTATTDEDNAAIIVVLDNDFDVDGDNLTVTGASDGANGTTIVNADGTVTYTPDADFFGTDSFTYTVSDGTVSSVATVDVTVNPVNDAPVAIDQVFTTPIGEDEVFSRVFGTDLPIGNVATDVDSPLTPSSFGFTAVSVNSLPLASLGAAGISYDASTGLFELDPTGLSLFQALDDGESASISVDFDVTDGFLTDTGTFDFEIAGANDAPVGNDDVATTNEDQAVTISVLLNDSDIDGDALTVASAINGANGTTSVNADGTVTYTPDADFFGTDSFTYTVSDGTVSSVATVNVTIDPVNDAPIANDDVSTTDEDQAVTISVLLNDSDIDADALTVASATDGANGTTIVNADGTVTYTPDADFFGTDSFTYEVSDGIDSHTAVVDVTVNPVNDAPVAIDQVFATPIGEDEVFSRIIGTDLPVGNVATDVDSPLTRSSFGFTAVSVNGLPLASLGAAGISYDASTGFFEVDPTGLTLFQALDDGESASVSVDFTVTDGLLTDTGTFDFEIAGANDAPVGNDDVATTDEDQAVTISVLLNDSDIDGDALTVASAINGANGTTSVNADGTVTYTPDADFFGTDSFTYTVSDGTVSSVATVNVTIDPVNDAPIANDDVATTDEDQAVTISVLLNDSDIDADALTVASATDGANGTTIVNADGTVTYTPDADFFGTDSFTYEVSDGIDSHTAVVDVTVNPVNDAPMVDQLLADQSFAEDTPVVFALSPDAFVDVDSPLTYTATLVGGKALPDWLSFDDATLGFTGTPPADFNGTFDIEVTASDGEFSAADSFRLEITPVNDAPIAADDDGFSLDQDQSITIAAADLLANDADIDGDPLSIVSVGNATNGTVSLVGNDVVYTPDAGYAGTAQFDYTLSDGSLADTATVSLSVILVDIYAGFEQGTDGRDFMVGEFFQPNQLFGAGGNDIMIGGVRDDHLAGGDGRDRLWGLHGNDTLDGNDGRDTLIGGLGDDEIAGGRGQDFSYGGAGSDVFIYEEGDGVDHIVDFSTETEGWFALGADRIRLGVDGVEDFETAMEFATQSGNRTTFDFGDGDQLVVRNTRIDDFTADVFEFL